MRRTAYRLNAPTRETYLLWQVPQTVLWRTLSRDGRLLYPRTPASETLRRLLYPRTTCRSRGSSAGSAPRVILQVYHDRVAFTVTSACRESTRSGRPRLSVQLSSSRAGRTYWCGTRHDARCDGGAAYGLNPWPQHGTVRHTAPSGTRGAIRGPCGISGLSSYSSPVHGPTNLRACVPSAHSRRAPRQHARRSLKSVPRELQG